LTRARDENRATTFLGGGAGPGFAVLCAQGDNLGAPRFAPGATRAGAASRLRYSGVVAVAKEIARLVKPIVQDWRAKVYPTNPTTGMMLDGEKAARANEVRAVLDPVLMTGENKDEPLNVSAYNVIVNDPATGRYVDNGQIPVSIPFVTLGEAEDVSVDIAAHGTITVNG
jgi:hypothetical protein